MTHPKLTAALAALDNGDAAAILAVALSARAAADEGCYCECAEPKVTGLDLMCAECLLNNKDQERARVRSFAHAHDFNPDTARFDGAFCKVCVRRETDPRHHGVNAVGRTSWGELV